MCVGGCAPEANGCTHRAVDVSVHSTPETASSEHEGLIDESAGMG